MQVVELSMFSDKHSRLNNGSSRINLHRDLIGTSRLPKKVMTSKFV